MDCDAIRAELEAALERSSVHGAYLLEGGPAAERRALGLWFASRLLGQPRMASSEPDAHPEHPDLKWVEPEGGVIRVAAVRRVQVELSLAAHEGGRRVALIVGAEQLRLEAANALLKLLEEPPRGAVLVLLAGSASALPATLRSRTVCYRLAPWPEERLCQALEGEGLAPEDAALAGALGGGSLAGARAWADANLEQARALRESLASIGQLSAGEVLDLAESYRGEGARERTELLLAVHGALAREGARRAAQAGDPAGVRRWVERFEAGERARGELARRNLNPQLIVEGLLLDLRASQPRA
jgi:DNA polymerase-3 subunit delta'